MAAVARTLPEEGAELSSGRYVLGRRIGEGAMGAVYEATHVKLRHKVAVKMLRPEVLTNPEIVARFEREGRLVSQLTGRHACRIHDVDTTDGGVPFIVMEFLDGTDLATEIERRGRLDVAEACEVVRQAASGLAEAHELGIVHRDLKPQNIFLARSRDDALGWVAKVLDFGISKVAGPEAHTTMTHVALGTPLYMSPEQVRSAKRVDARSDVWALGVVLFESLTGVVPFPGESATAVAAAIVADEARSLAALRADLPAGLVRIVEHALTKDVSRRVQSALELRALLEPFAVGAPRLSLSGESPARVAPVPATLASEADSASTSGVQPTPRMFAAEATAPARTDAAMMLGDEPTELPPPESRRAHLDEPVSDGTSGLEEVTADLVEEPGLVAPLGPLPPPRVPPPRLASITDDIADASTVPAGDERTNVLAHAKPILRGGTVPLAPHSPISGFSGHSARESGGTARSGPRKAWADVVRRVHALEPKERWLAGGGIAAACLIGIALLIGTGRAAEPTPSSATPSSAPVTPTEPVPAEPPPTPVPSASGAAPAQATITATATPRPASTPVASPARPSPPVGGPARPSRPKTCPASQKILVNGKLVCPG